MVYISVVMSKALGIEFGAYQDPSSQPKNSPDSTHQGSSANFHQSQSGECLFILL